MANTSQPRSGGDRRKQRQARFEERRTGFDRRRTYPLLGALRDSPWTLLSVLVLLNLMSAADGALTAAELSAGIAREANPVFGGLIGRSPLLAAGFKLAVMVAVSILIWRWRRYRLILVIAVVALAIYALVLAYHIENLRGFGWI